jgi:hypothetical protein
MADSKTTILCKSPQQLKRSSSAAPLGFDGIFQLVCDVMDANHLECAAQPPLAPSCSNCLSPTADHNCSECGPLCRMCVRWHCGPAHADEFTFTCIRSRGCRWCRYPSVRPAPELTKQQKSQLTEIMTFEEIGALLGLSRQRVQQIYKRAVAIAAGKEVPLLYAFSYSEGNGECIHAAEVIDNVRSSVQTEPSLTQARATPEAVWCKLHANFTNWKRDLYLEEIFKIHKSNHVRH